MEKMYCKECGKKISASAKACPFCGASFTQQGNSQKKRTTAMLLALFLGGVGGHKFYLGKFGQGILYIVFIWTFIPAILAMIEFFILLVMSDNKFDELYNS